MAAPRELVRGLRSVDLDSLAVRTYARFTGAPLKVRKVTNSWWSPSGTLPALRTRQGEAILRPHKTSPWQGADPLAFRSPLEGKLRPARLSRHQELGGRAPEVVCSGHALSAQLLPAWLQAVAVPRGCVSCVGELRLENREELEQELEQETRGRPTLLSQHLGSQTFFFGDASTALDTLVFGFLTCCCRQSCPVGRPGVPPPCQTVTEEEPQPTGAGGTGSHDATPAPTPGTQSLGTVEDDEEEQLIRPLAPRTDFSTGMHSRSPCVSPLLVAWKWGAHSQRRKLSTLRRETKKLFSLSVCMCIRYVSPLEEDF
uniref:Metaxin-1 n=1 Tax=Felis catus TaxID=9685 RepID=A0ABI7X6C5_FELCA